MNDEALAAELKAEADGLDDEAAMENAQRLMRLAAERLLELEKYAEPESELAYKIGRDSVLKAIRDIISPHIQPGKINPDIDLVFAEIRRLESTQQWRPIEEVTQDAMESGTVYDLWSPKTHTYVLVGRYWTQDELWSEDGTDYVCEPTHFRERPLPPAPAMDLGRAIHEEYRRAYDRETLPNDVEPSDADAHIHAHAAALNAVIAPLLAEVKQSRERIAEQEKELAELRQQVGKAKKFVSDVEAVVSRRSEIYNFNEGLEKMADTARTLLHEIEGEVGNG